MSISFQRVDMCLSFALIQYCRSSMFCLAALFSLFKRLLSNSICAYLFCLMVIFNFSRDVLASWRLLSVIAIIYSYYCIFFEEAYSRCRDYSRKIYNSAILDIFAFSYFSKVTILFCKISFSFFYYSYFCWISAINKSVSIVSEQCFYFCLFIFWLQPGWGVGDLFLSVTGDSIRLTIFLRGGVWVLGLGLGLILTQNLLRSMSDCDFSEDVRECYFLDDNFESCLLAKRQERVDEESQRDDLRVQLVDF